MAKGKCQDREKPTSRPFLTHRGPSGHVLGPFFFDRNFRSGTDLGPALGQGQNPSKKPEKWPIWPRPAVWATRSRCQEREKVGSGPSLTHRRPSGHILRSFFFDQNFRSGTDLGPPLGGPAPTPLWVGAGPGRGPRKILNLFVKGIWQKSAFWSKLDLECRQCDRAGVWRMTQISRSPISRPCAFGVVWIAVKHLNSSKSVTSTPGHPSSKNAPHTRKNSLFYKALSSGELTSSFSRFRNDSNIFG